jgi:succinyl-CoA synthetase beta subunit
MNIHEYQAKELLAKFGVPVPGGVAALSVDEAVAAVDQLPGPLYVVKAQIHAGGRGKGKFKELGPDAKGGVRLARSADEVRAAAQDMLGNTLVTIQTGPEGKQVNRLYVTDGVDIAKEFYLALLVDRATGRVSFVVSTEGGMNIEDVAHDTPEKIQTFSVDPAPGLQPHHGRAVAAALGLSGDLAKQAQNVAAKLYDAFLGTDAEQIEINPLAITGRQQAAGARRQGRLRRQRHVPPQGFDGAARRVGGGPDGAGGEQVRPRLHQARRQYRLHGQRRGPGHGDDGHHQAERRLPGQLPRRRRRRFEGEGHARFKIILADPAVKGILVNIFGGIMKCDIIAEGIIAAAREVICPSRSSSASKAPT